MHAVKNIISDIRKSAIKSALLVLFVGIVVCAIRVAPLAKPREVISLGEEEMIPHWENNHSWQYFTFINIDRGIYTVILDFDATQELTAFAKTWWEGNGDVYSTPVPLMPFEHHKEFRIMAEKNGAVFTLEISSAAENETFVPATVLVNIVYRPKMTMFCYACYTLFPFLLLIILMGIMHYCRSKNDPALGRVAFLLTALSFFLCIPLFCKYVPSIGYDTTFHMMRIGHLAEALMSPGSLFRIQAGWHSDLGYPLGIFYGEILMVPSALLHALGLPLWQSYQFYLMILILLTVWGGYFCFRRITGSRVSGLLTCLIYSGSMWFLTRLYIFSALGESAAAAFIPWVLLGFYELFASGHRCSVWYLAFGFSGLLQSHNITFVQVCMFSAVFCLLRIRMLFRDGRLKNLLLAAGAAILVNLWFLVPFLDYYIRYDLHLEQVGELLFMQSIPEMFFPSEYMFTSPGYSALAVLILSAYLVFTRKEKDSRSYNERCLFWMAIASLFLASIYVPWDFLKEYLPAVYGLIGGRIQVPFRYYTIAVGLISMLFAYVIRDRRLSLNPSAVRTGVIMIASVTLLQDTYMLHSVINDRDPRRQLDTPALGENGGGDWLYLPEEFARYYQFLETPDLEIHSSGADLEYTLTEKQGIRHLLQVKNHAESDLSLEFPLWNYYGYTARGDEGQRFEITEGEHFRLAVNIPGGYEGSLLVSFTTPLYWHIAEAVSVIAVIGICILGIRRLRR